MRIIPDRQPYSTVVYCAVLHHIFSVIIPSLSLLSMLINITFRCVFSQTAEEYGVAEEDAEEEEDEALRILTEDG